REYPDRLKTPFLYAEAGGVELRLPAHDRDSCQECWKWLLLCTDDGGKARTSVVPVVDRLGETSRFVRSESGPSNRPETGRSPLGAYYRCQETRDRGRRRFSETFPSVVGQR